MPLSPCPPAITDAERLQRLSLLRDNFSERGVSAVLLGSTESLRYYTGLVWHGSERLVGAVVTPTELIYIVPGFERSRVESLPHLPGEIRVWQEEESSAGLVASLLHREARLAVDDAVPLFVYFALRLELGDDRLISGGPLIRALRCRKSANEIQLIQHAMNITVEVQRRTFEMIRPGVAASEVVRFIDDEHRSLGASGGWRTILPSRGRRPR